MKISPQIEIHERYQQEKKQLETVWKPSGNKIRKNNRKSSRSRKCQFAITITKTWPIMIIRKNIKTNK